MRQTTKGTDVVHAHPKRQANKKSCATAHRAARLGPPRWSTALEPKGRWFKASVFDGGGVRKRIPGSQIFRSSPLSFLLFLWLFADPDGATTLRAPPQDLAQHLFVQPLSAERPRALLREAASKPATEMANVSCIWQPVVLRRALLEGRQANALFARRSVRSLNDPLTSSSVSLARFHRTLMAGSRRPLAR